MKCPNCGENFFHQMKNATIGENKEGQTMMVQMCPSCKDPIVGIRAKKPDEFYVLASDTKGLILLH
jgi:hypothetical protein